MFSVCRDRSLDAGLNNKANELQEDISLKRFDVRVAQMHLGALKAQVRDDTSLWFGTTILRAEDLSRE